jgi:hypothetical protein
LPSLSASCDELSAADAVELSESGRSAAVAAGTARPTAAAVATRETPRRRERREEVRDMESSFP